MFSDASQNNTGQSQQTHNTPLEESLEHLILRSGDRAIHNMAYVFRRQLKETDLLLITGSRKQLVKNEYHSYEQRVCSLLTRHWQGTRRALKKQIRRFLKPFRKSVGLLQHLLNTPARITASACLMVIIGSGQNAAATKADPSSDFLQLHTPPATLQKSMKEEVIFVDTTLPDHDLLLQGAPAGATVVLLEPSTSLIGQILDHLLQSGPTASLHIFTHGAPGEIRLGQTIIDQTSLRKQAKQLEMLGNLLKDSRDIYLYGCEIAQGQKGHDFIQLLSTFTRADVAASDNLTGAAKQGGDWELELVTGNMNKPGIVSLDYGAILAAGKVIAGDGSGGGGGGSYTSNGGKGGNGGGDADILEGSPGDDVLFGDGSGGGCGGNYFMGGCIDLGIGGSGSDTISGGPGDDILFGDGFDGNGSDKTGGDGGFGGGGGGGGGYEGAGGKGGIGGGGGGGGDYATAGGNGTIGGGGGAAGGYSAENGLGGNFGATDGDESSAYAGGGGGGGFPVGSGGAGGSYAGSSAGNGGNGGSIVYSEPGSTGGNGGNGGDYQGGGGGGGGFGSDGAGGGGNGVNDGTGGGYGTNGGVAPVTLKDENQTAHTYVMGKLSTLAALPGGSGDDTLDGGPGSDHLFGMGGTNTFVFESDDASSGSDEDTIYDWNNGTSNQIKLTIGGQTVTPSQVNTIIAAQTEIGTDRSIVHQSGSNQVTITFKEIDRDLVSADFIQEERFPWAMFLPAITGAKK